MARGTLWLTLFVLSVVVIPPHMAAKTQEAGTVSQQAKPWQFIASGTRYLHSTTLNYTGASCIPAKIGNSNNTARTFAQRMELKGSTGPRSTNTAYYKLVKHHGLVKAITSGDRQTGEAIIYTFSYTLKDCAVLKTQKKE
uniref:Lipocalin n=1 Tax=Rhipicephalus zambeziensis TaxID=60191 RepID=A0A224YLN5_9ACAR